MVLPAVPEVLMVHTIAYYTTLLLSGRCGRRILVASMVSHIASAFVMVCLVNCIDHHHNPWLLAAAAAAWLSVQQYAHRPGLLLLVYVWGSWLGLGRDTMVLGAAASAYVGAYL